MSSEILKNLLLEDKKLREENKKLRKENKDKLIEKLQKRIEKRKKKEKLRQEKSVLESKTKSKTKPKSIPKQKVKTFDEYFQECIKNRTIPKDTPGYLKKALERAMKEYDKGIKHVKSALSKYAEKYVIDGKPKMLPSFYFSEKNSSINRIFEKSPKC